MPTFSGSAPIFPGLTETFPSYFDSVTTFLNRRLFFLTRILLFNFGSDISCFALIVFCLDGDFSWFGVDFYWIGDLLVSALTFPGSAETLPGSLIFSWFASTVHASGTTFAFSGLALAQFLLNRRWLSLAFRRLLISFAGSAATFPCSSPTVTGYAAIFPGSVSWLKLFLAFPFCRSTSTLSVSSATFPGAQTDSYGSAATFTGSAAIFHSSASSISAFAVTY